MIIFLKIIDEEEGATSAEYAIMVTLIAASIITAVTLLGSSVIDLFTKGDLPSVIAGAS
jgi:Flp pilus assembly pilin Flp